jgi:four helix bundle protein
MKKEDLAQRTRVFAVRVFKRVRRIQEDIASRVVIHQLLRASSSVAANYRAVNVAKSRADFGFKLKVVLEEVDECNFWLGFAVDVDVVSANDAEVQWLTAESVELLAIFTASVKTYNASKYPKI